jgi:hypothetical protein
MASYAAGVIAIAIMALNEPVDRAVLEAARRTVSPRRVSFRSALCKIACNNDPLRGGLRVQ